VVSVFILEKAGSYLFEGFMINILFINI